ILPLLAAALTQFAAARTQWGKKLEEGVSAAMVPLMMATLGIIVASEVSGVSHQVGSLFKLRPLSVAGAAIVMVLGALISPAAKLNTPARRAVTFSAVTRKLLLILPSVLAVPAPFALARVVVVTVSVVEVCVVILMVWAVPRT